MPAIARMARSHRRSAVARVERSDTRETTAHKKTDPEVGFLYCCDDYNASRLLAPSTRRAMPRGLAFFRASGSRASGQFW